MMVTGAVWSTTSERLRTVRKPLSFNTIAKKREDCEKAEIDDVLLQVDALGEAPSRPEGVRLSSGHCVSSEVRGIEAGGLPAHPQADHFIASAMTGRDVPVQRRFPALLDVFLGDGDGVDGEEGLRRFLPIRSRPRHGAHSVAPIS